MTIRGASNHARSRAPEAGGVDLDAASVPLRVLQPGISTPGGGASDASRRAGPVAEGIHILSGLDGHDASIGAVDASEVAFVVAQRRTPGSTPRVAPRAGGPLQARIDRIGAQPGLPEALPGR